MSPGKAYVPESADLQLELLRRSWEKYPYRRKTGEKLRRESPNCNSPYFCPEATQKHTMFQHCFESGDTKWASGLFPAHRVYLHQKSLPPEMQKSEGKSKMCILLHVFWLKWWTEKALRQQQTLSSQKSCTTRQQNRLGSHPALPPVAKATRGSQRELLTIWDNWRNITAITYWSSPFKASLATLLHYGPVCAMEGCQSFLCPAQVVMAKSSEDSHAPPTHTTLLKQCQIGWQASEQTTQKRRMLPSLPLSCIF